MLELTANEAHLNPDEEGLASTASEMLPLGLADITTDFNSSTDSLGFLEA